MWKRPSSVSDQALEARLEDGVRSAERCATIPRTKLGHVIAHVLHTRHVESVRSVAGTLFLAAEPPKVLDRMRGRARCKFDAKLDSFPFPSVTEEKRSVVCRLVNNGAQLRRLSSRLRRKRDIFVSPLPILSI